VYILMCLPVAVALIWEATAGRCSLYAEPVGHNQAETSEQFGTGWETLHSCRIPFNLQGHWQKIWCTAWCRACAPALIPNLN